MCATWQLLLDLHILSYSFHYEFGHLISNLISRVVLAEADCIWLLLGLLVSTLSFSKWPVCSSSEIQVNYTTEFKSIRF